MSVTIPHERTRALSARHLPPGAGLVVLGVLGAIGALLLLFWQVLGVQDALSTTTRVATTSAEQRDELAADVDALRGQVEDLGATPVAPPAEDTVDAVPGPATPLPGEDGAEGPSGLPGAPGASGAPGVPGEPGQAGAEGSDGLDGAAGSPGLDGGAGTDGQDGADGVDGPSGADGADGAQGPAGADGRDGRGVSSVQCLDDPDGTGSTWVIRYDDGTSSTSPGPCRVRPQPTSEPSPTVDEEDAP